MVINPRRHQLLCGVNGAIKVYDLDEGMSDNPLVSFVTLLVFRYKKDLT